MHGKRIIEVSAGLAGQHAGFALAGLGARVLTVHQPGPTGRNPALDTGKELVELDLTTPSGFEALVSLCAGCDLFIEERAPSGWPAGGALSTRLVQRQSDLLAVCISPFGLTGPYADLAAYPLNSYHSGGNAQHIPCDWLRPQDRERAPLQAGGHWGEAQVGTLAAVAGLACMLNPAVHAGTVIDCSCQEALISFYWPEVARFPNEGRAPTRLAPLATIVGGILPTMDGHVQVAVREDHQWAALATLLLHPEWESDECFSTRAARTSRPAEISRLLATETVKFSSGHLHGRGRQAGIPIAAVMRPQDLFDDTDLIARGAWRSSDRDGVRLPRWDSGVSTWAAPVHVAVPVPGSRARPLSGLRVLDFGWVAMGPYAGYVLAALGAEVIHIARPVARIGGGVDLSHYNYGFDTLNTGKTWVSIDLKTPAGVEAVHALAAGADIVLDNFRPGVTRRLGIDYATLAAINPRLVMLSASTYGERAMGGSYVGYAPVFSALAGLAHFTGFADGPPAEVSHPVDFYAGSVGVLGLIAGLHRLAATGQGCHIDLSAREAILWSLTAALAEVQAGTAAGERLGNGHAHMAPHGTYRCAGENRWISIAVARDEEWRALCACMQDTELADDERLAHGAGRLQHQALIERRISAWTLGRDVFAVVEQLQLARVAAFLSATAADLWNDAHLQARQVFLPRQVDGETRWYIGAPWAYDHGARLPLDTVTGMVAIGKAFGGVAGMTLQRIESLLSQGVIGPR